MFANHARLSAVAAAAGLILAACGSSSSAGNASNTSPTSAPAAAPSPTTAAPASGATTTMAMMPLPASAAAMKLTLTSPSADKVVTDNKVDFTVAASGYTLACDEAGKPLRDGVGHYHLLIDKSLVNMLCTTSGTLSLQNVSPGKHELEVVPAINDHAEVMDNAQKFTFDYQPTAALKEITDVANPGTPAISIVSPKPGTTVTGDFDVVVQTTNFNLSCDLYGKPAVIGYGHYHINLDSTAGPMMGMMTMLGMGCETTFKASTKGLKTGEKHTVIALLTDNGHAPLNPPVEATVEVTVG